MLNSTGWRYRQAMITGTKVRIRALETGDRDRISAWRNKRSIQDQLIGWHWPTSPENESDWLNAIRNDSVNKRFAIEASDGKHIGNIGVYDIDWIWRQCGFGLFIGDDNYRGKGYAFDASKALLEFVFSEVGMHRVWVYILASNEPSIKHFTRLGFTHEGVLREHNFRSGVFVNVNVMGLIDTDFRK